MELGALTVSVAALFAVGDSGAAGARVVGSLERTGFFFDRHPRFGVWLRRFATFYFAVMVARYVIVMALWPERRWFGGTIPIFFHWILASYLFVWSRHHERVAN